MNNFVETQNMESAKRKKQKQKQKQNWDKRNDGADSEYRVQFSCKKKKKQQKRNKTKNNKNFFTNFSQVSLEQVEKMKTLMKRYAILLVPPPPPPPPRTFSSRLGSSKSKQASTKTYTITNTGLSVGRVIDLCFNQNLHHH